MQSRKRLFILALAAIVWMIGEASNASDKLNANNQTTPPSTEGPLIAAEILAGPFDIHRQYESMMGPYVTVKTRLGSLISDKRTIIPEADVVYVEGSPPPSMGGPDMSAHAPANTSAAQPGRIDRELYWFKGMKIVVLDENDQPLSNAEFICHVNVDVDTRFRHRSFKSAAHHGNSRLMTLTQGQTEFIFPPGFAVPVDTHEAWSLVLQAANRTTTQHRRLKQLCTLYFIKDSELKEPIKALHWYTPYVSVVLGKEALAAPEHDGAPHCLGMSEGEAARNMVAASIVKDQQGRKLTGHWQVPPGTHVYRTQIPSGHEDDLAAKDRKVHAVWSHVHPLCTNASLVACDGRKRSKVFSAEIQTNTAGGLQLASIQNIVSSRGIRLKAGKNYELEATYVNSTEDVHDSMVALGIFCEDELFKRPAWTQASETINHSCPAPNKVAKGDKKDAMFCGIRPDDDLSEEPAETPEPAPSYSYPLFDATTDGPLLTRPSMLEITTSAGVLHLRLNPLYAPHSATQMYKLFTSGAFNGTPIFRYQEGYLFQVAPVESKVDSKYLLAQSMRELLKSLPLEAPLQPLHKKWALTMARDANPNSAVSSFSILLADSPHLDGKYTVIGEVVPDAVSLQTIDAIQKRWSTDRPWISEAHEIKDSVATFDHKTN